MRGLTIASGVLMVATGVFCFINPGQTFLTMAFVVGSVMTICGIIHALAYFIGRGFHNKGDNNGWVLIDALLTLLLGILILFNQLTVDMAIPMIFGIWVLVSGLLRLEASTRINRQVKPGNFMAASITGIITISVGILGFINPLVTYVSVIILLGVFLIIQGVNSIELGLHMPHDKKDEVTRKYSKPNKAIIIGDDMDESEEMILARKKARKEEELEQEFTRIVARTTIGLSREESEKVAEEIRKRKETEAKAARETNNEV
ncbi:MAG: DUF308 domain-containing protein [Eubacteriales bacterium]|nr:DUF308 domain-containing protein [Eubacteriales bacterium]